MNAKLYLLPNLLDPSSPKEMHFPSYLEQIIGGLDGLIAESPKSAYAYLKLFTFPPGKSFRDLPLWILNEHTTDKEIREFGEKELIKGIWGLISDAGLPCLADPGAKMVRVAKEKEVEVKAISGPSSIILSLMLSGLPSQKFSFHGYLEKEASLLKKQIHTLELAALKEKITQIFIETPYRNQKLFEMLLNTLSEKTFLCVAWDLTAQTEEVRTLRISEWKKTPLPSLDKKPAVFLFAT